MIPNLLPLLAGSLMLFAQAQTPAQDSFRFQLQSQSPSSSGGFETRTREETWTAGETAIIVCDTWDLHHCLNAVRRLEQFAPRLDLVLMAARKQGATIIHAPSDCMDAYRNHPARQRAMATPKVAVMPAGIESWCSSIPSEEKAVYPIDQSDGGEDDDPEEHAQWAAKLKAMGRNPGTPWKKQSDLITIDKDQDYISDRGDEVWNILQHKGIKNVILTGVHTNMCVLGRPFGLRQMVRNGKNVVLMRDMTDTMYNPKRWPYVSHFEGTRRIISHIERYVCPTITSDQVIGGKPFRFKGDSGTESSPSDTSQLDLRRHWTTVSVPHVGDPPNDLRDGESIWYRCVVRIPKPWLKSDLALRCPAGAIANAWVNGTELASTSVSQLLEIPAGAVHGDDANLLVVRMEGKGAAMMRQPLELRGLDRLALAGQWQVRIGKDESLSSMPLPAKFGGSSDIVFAPEPRWIARPLTAEGVFTKGIEGPACDAHGNVFAVNFETQGTIGKVTPDGHGEVFVTLPEGSVGNGIRFAPDGTFFVADYTGHNVLRVDPNTKQISVHAHSDDMNQPNDLAIMPDGITLFASDPNWSMQTGQLWRIDKDGKVTLVAKDMGTTNGIEVSPDGKTLYVNESKQRNLWAFKITKDGELAEKRLVRQFSDYGFDGMRCDVHGNLYLTRHGKGTVVMLDPSGETLREVSVLGSKPSNLCFGGLDGRTVYVTEVDSGRLVTFRVDHPGRSWAELQSQRERLVD